MSTNWWHFATLLFGAVPVVIGAVAVRIGSRQAREFHDRTGDVSLITSIAALSRFTGKVEVHVREPELDLEPKCRKTDRAAQHVC